MTTGAEPKTILIIEDEPDIMKFASKVLELEGHRILGTWNASTGLATLRETPVDLIVLDLMLPGMDGWEMIDQLKGDPKLSTIPVLVFSAAVELSNRERAVSMGVADFLMKPLSAGTLRDAVNSVLQAQQGT